MMGVTVKLIFVILVLCGAVNTKSKESKGKDNDIPHNEVANWATKFGVQLWEIGRQTTRLKDIQERYQQEATVRPNDGLQILRQMADDTERMIQSKMEAVRRIMDVAEQASMSHVEDSGIVANYYNAKRLNEWNQEKDGTQGELKEGYKELSLTQNPNFFNVPVNLSLSAVHVPTNVFDGSPDVLNSLYWSEHLNRIFVNNYEQDPTLSWQFFGSATGYMRQYPASRWQRKCDFYYSYECDRGFSRPRLKSKHSPPSCLGRANCTVKWPQDEYEADLFDCRVRPWYIQAAASAKDMIILLDTSGSMTGVRREIARHVVINLLETLSDNDFVNIFRFGERPEPVVKCFKDKLVQANLENVRELRHALEGLDSVNIANFTASLTHSFELLERYNRTNGGAQCNQAIMIVTDGAPVNYQEIFEKYNWPHKPVRIFTYLIGREVTDTSATSWMSCHNKGYFTHVTTLAEVREQVLKYIPVLARPMVLYQNNHPVTWSHVYADMTDPKLSDWLWEVRERRRQRDRTMNFRRLHRTQMEQETESAFFEPTEVELFLQYGQWHLSQRQLEVLESNKRKAYAALRKKKRGRKRFGRSVDVAQKAEPKAEALTQLSRITLLLERIKGKTANSNPRYRLMTTVATPVYDRRNYTVRTANLLGVAGTDVPIKELQKMTPAYKLGVNAYSFITTNNGYVLFHPDYRPIYQDILKPNFNAVDMSEVELVNSTDEPRHNDTLLMAMRREIIERKEGEINLTVRVHYDSMKRALLRNHTYFYKPLKDTPFTLAVVQPKGYGEHRVEGQTEIKLYRLGNVSDLFKKKNWKVHPDWVYCKYMYDMPELALLTPEAEVRHFMERSQKPAWKWRSRYGVHSAKDFNKGGSFAKRLNKEEYFCDKDLFQSLVFDTIATQPFDEKGLIKYSKSDGLGILKMFGVSIIFVATRSGLIKWHDEATLAERTVDDTNGFEENGKRNPYRKHHTRLGHGRSKRRAKKKSMSRFASGAYGRTPSKVERHFSELNNKAIDEIWYKRAVEQNRREPESFVYSLPFDAGIKNNSLVTASHAIFVQRDGNKAPAAVVGLQFKHSTFAETFFNISHTCSAGAKCNRTCASEELECYVLDDNGFIIISEKSDNSGKFFGEVDGTIMDSLVHYDIYKKIRIYDYQSVCFDQPDKKSSASFLLTPFKMLQWTVRWTVGRLAWLAVQTQLSQLLNEKWSWAVAELANDITEELEEEESAEPSGGYGQQPDYVEQQVIEEDQSSHIEDAYINKTRVRPCDRQVDLYSLQFDKLFDKEHQLDKPLKGRLASCSQSNFGEQCGRSFTAHLIRYSNLVLVVVDTMCPCGSRHMSVQPVEVVYNKTERCERLTEHLFRHRPTECISYHPEEEEIKLCGKGAVNTLSSGGLLLSVLVILRYIVQS